MSQNSRQPHDFDIAFLNELTKKHEECHLITWGNENIQPPFQIMPKDFLNYAEYDLNNDYLSVNDKIYIISG